VSAGPLANRYVPFHHVLFAQIIAGTLSKKGLVLYGAHNAGTS